MLSNNVQDERERKRPCHNMTGKKKKTQNVPVWRGQEKENKALCTH